MNNPLPRLMDEECILMIEKCIEAKNSSKMYGE